jgi:hypothetical protein
MMQLLHSKQRDVALRRLPDIIGLGGAVAGFLAGLAMIVVSPLLSLLTGIGVWEPPKHIAATVYGPAVLDTPGFVLGPVVTGTLLHMLIATVLGSLFGILINRVLHLTTDFGFPIYVGLVYGLLCFLVSFFIILPVVNPTLQNSYMGPVMVQHLVFGIGLGLFYTVVRPLPYTE